MNPQIGNMASLKTGLTAVLLAASSTTALQDIPPLGLGTWLSDREKVPHAVEFGLKNGYDHIDAAWIYRMSYIYTIRLPYNRS